MQFLPSSPRPADPQSAVASLNIDRIGVGLCPHSTRTHRTGPRTAAKAPDWSFGATVAGTVRLSENSNDYTLGDRLAVTAWWSYRWDDWISTSARLNYELWGNIDGADPDLNPRMVPTADPDRRGGERLDLLFGVNLFAPDGGLAGHRLAIEVGFPIYQRLDGPQLETDLIVTVGWQFAF